MLFDSGCVSCGGRGGPVCTECEGALVRAPSTVVAGVDVCRVAFVLDDRSRPIVAALKYGGQRRLAQWLAVRNAHLVPRAADVITWVPATPERRLSRGFDQGEQLARRLSAYTTVPAMRLLQRQQSDTRQTGQSRSDRLEGPNLRPNRAAPELVVLCDDVITTGSSLRNAAQALRAAGAQRVVGVVVASTQEKRRLSQHGLEKPSSIHKWT